MPRVLRVATRGSDLARWQAQRVIDMLASDAELVIVTTTGDARSETPIHQMGGTGVFVKEVQQAVLGGHADIAVHSAKDLPATPSPDGLALVAVPERADPRDALVGSTLDGLPAGAVVGTGAVRRRALLAALRPDLTFSELRGNIPTRLEKASQFDAIVVAAAALERLGLLARADEILDPSVMLPQVAQGALAVECRDADEETRSRLAAIDDAGAHREVDAERSFLAHVGGSCDLPCGALARATGASITLDALLASPDGRTVVRTSREGTDPEKLGREVARDVLERGGRDLLDTGGEPAP